MRKDTFETLKLTYSTQNGNKLKLKNASGKLINVLCNTSTCFEFWGEKLKQEFVYLIRLKHLSFLALILFVNTMYTSNLEKMCVKLMAKRFPCQIIMTSLFGQVGGRCDHSPTTCSVMPSMISQTV